MYPFSFSKATDERSALAAAASGARYIAGGTTLVDLMRETVERPTAVVDINGLPYRSIDLQASRLRIGSLVRMSALAAHPDAVFIPIDSPGLHLALARAAKRMGNRVVYYVCPQIWAWGGGRIRRLREDVDLTLLLFEFESGLLEKGGAAARWVGHPAGALRAEPERRAKAKEMLGLDPKEQLVALLPGSRRDEVRRHLAPMLDGAARVIAQLGGRVRAAVSDAGQVEAARRAPEIGALWDTLAPLRWQGDAKDLVRGADVAVVASGTATLETAALGVPQVIVYKTGWLNYEIARRLVRVPSIGLANLVAGVRAAPELIQRDATGPRVAAELAKLLTDPGARDAQRKAFAGIPERLGGPGAADRAAAALIEFVGRAGAA